MPYWEVFQIKEKAIPVRGYVGPQNSELSRLPHFLDNHLADGSEVVSLNHWLPFTPQDDSWYSSLLEGESLQDP
jgi:hypothetical protein